MLIHKGKRFEISSDGDKAVKSDGASSQRTMRFFPERDVRNIAGELDELSAWCLLHDIALLAHDKNTPIAPEHIFIDDDCFYLSDWSESLDPKFQAPEGYSPVWALGATLFFVFLGCHVFQARGGKGQSPTTPVPVLRRHLPELSALVARCLDYYPENRPSLREIVEVAASNITRLEGLLPQPPPLKTIADSQISHDRLDALWPDEM